MNKLSIIIPCFNEEKNIENILNKVWKVELKGIEKEIIVVDDCSSDSSRTILNNNKKIIDKILVHEINKGKGAALRTGIEYATGDYIIVQDADDEYDPGEFSRLLQPLINNDCDVVYGSRFKNKKYDKGYRLNRLANRFLTSFSNLFTKYKLTDMETCYKVFKRDIIKKLTLEENRFGFEPEITAKLSKIGAKIIEVPIEYKPRTKAEGKKINLKDGFRAIYCIIKYRWGVRIWEY